MTRISEDLKWLCEKLSKEFGSIPEYRKQLLDQIAAAVAGSHQRDGNAKLMYICTHNSRRSHFGQIWGALAAGYYRVDSIETFSGGTEQTAFHPNAIASLRRTGFKIEPLETATNPVYKVVMGEDFQINCFSKVYDHHTNPSNGFIAIMTCSEADQDCPLIVGADFRFSLPYEDPKVADGSPAESETYDIRNRQIGMEQLYLFDGVSKLLIQG